MTCGLTKQQIEVWNRRTEGTLYYWCMRCKRVYHRSIWIKHAWHCPTAKCGGHFYDKVSWVMVKRQNLSVPDAPPNGVQFNVNFQSSEDVNADKH